MKLWIISVLLLVCLSLTIPFVAADDDKDSPKAKEGKITIVPTEPIVTVATPDKFRSADPTRLLTPTKKLQVGTSVSVEYSNTDPLGPMKELIGIPDNSGITVTISGKPSAVLPPESPLIGMSVHQECLKYQYGTVNYYNCEVALQ